MCGIAGIINPNASKDNAIYKNFKKIILNVDLVLDHQKSFKVISQIL